MQGISGNLSLFRMQRPVESNTQTYHGRVGAGQRTAGRRGGAGTGKTERRPPLPFQTTYNRPFFFQTIEKTLLGESLEARTIKILCKPMDEHFPRLTSGSSEGRNPLLFPGC